MPETLSHMPKWQKKDAMSVTLVEGLSKIYVYLSYDIQGTDTG